MRFNVLRSILIPWFLFFFLSVGFFVFSALKLPAPLQDSQIQWGLLAIGALACFLWNFRTLNQAGIWIADSLPYSVLRRPSNWIASAILAALVAFALYSVGQAAWMPLYWQGFVIPVTFTLALFIVVRSLLGLTLKTAARVSFTRLFVMAMSLPLLLLVGTTSLFLSKEFVSAYQASHAEFTKVASDETETVDTLATPPAANEEKKISAESAQKIVDFQSLAERNAASCSDANKEVLAALDPRGNEDVVYWAVKAVKCTDLKSMVALPRLAELVVKSKSPKIKAAAIQMMTKYSHEAIKPVGYLLVKQINDHEPKEVLEAASTVLSKVGEEERVLAQARLKNLLNSKSAIPAAEILIQKMHRADLVTDYVIDHVKESGEARNRAIGMICLLPEVDRIAANPFISDITAAIQQGRSSDPAMEALACMGPSGLQAVRKEVSSPSRLPRPLAAQALAEMDLKNDAETLKTVQDCLKDPDDEVRKWCSQSMGKVGKLALPHILELLRSNDPAQHREGQQALGTLNDPDVAAELRQVRAENSGWTANRKKFGIARDVSNALSRIENKKE